MLKLGSKPLMLSLVADDNILVATLASGFVLYPADKTNNEFKWLALPKGISNIQIKLGTSTQCLLSRDESLAVAGLRKELFVWDISSCLLIHQLQAHVGRIIKMASLTAGNANCILTSSIDKTIKVWDLDLIDEPVRSADSHDLPVVDVFTNEEGFITAGYFEI